MSLRVTLTLEDSVFFLAVLPALRNHSEVNRAPSYPLTRPNLKDSRNVNQLFVHHRCCISHNLLN